VIATGAASVRPPIDGIDLSDVFLLRWMDDAFAMLNRLKDRHRRSAVIVSAGYIGMEMADALTYRGMQVTVVEFADSVLTTVDPVTVALESWDHKAYYPGARKMWIRITGDRSSGRLLGAQFLGHRGSEVSKRIDVFATAIYNNIQVDDFNYLDLSYTPPLSSPWDPVQMSAQVWCRQLGQIK
jgi:pyruvate/2-oxoglutarate dehydrogenase complex dihydrolipoamide dehydrogenase (E3) component